MCLMSNFREKNSPKPRKLSTLTTSSHILGHFLRANVKYVDVDDVDVDDGDIDDDDDGGIDDDDDSC